MIGQGLMGIGCSLAQGFLLFRVIAILRTLEGRERSQIDFHTLSMRPFDQFRQPRLDLFGRSIISLPFGALADVVDAEQDDYRRDIGLRQDVAIEADQPHLAKGRPLGGARQPVPADPRIDHGKRLMRRVQPLIQAIGPGCRAVSVNPKAIGDRIAERDHGMPVGQA